MGQPAQPRSPCLRQSDPGKALNVMVTGFRVLGRPWALGRTDCSWGRDFFPTLVLLPASPNPVVLGSPGSAAHPFKSAQGVPRAALPSEGPGHQSDRRGIRLRKGRADPEEVLCPAPFHPGWEPTPGMPIWASASPCRPGREDWGLSCVTSLTPLPVSGPQLPQLLAYPAIAGWGWSRERSFGKLALSVRYRDHPSCLHTSVPPAGSMLPHSLSQVSLYKFREGRRLAPSHTVCRKSRRPVRSDLDTGYFLEACGMRDRLEVVGADTGAAVQTILTAGAHNTSVLHRGN